MKKLISFTLSLIMLISAVFPCAVAYADTYGDFEYTVDGSSVIIDKYNGNESTARVPHEINGATVTKIGDYAFLGIGEPLSDVELPSSITEIGNMAFAACPFLVSVSLPESLEKIGDDAFLQCPKLQYVNLGSMVNGIDGDTFDGCNGLLGFTVSEANPYYSSENGVLFNKDKTELIRYPSAAKASAYTVPDGVKKINKLAFFSAKSITEITLPESLETIEENAFRDADSITDVNVKKNEEEWLKVSVGEQGTSTFPSANYHYDYTPEPCEAHTKSGECKIIKAPTCTEKGVTEYVCSVCKQTFTEETDALGHTPEKLKRVAPTYFEKGKTEGEKCAVCGEILTPQKSIAKLVLAVPSKKKATAKKKGFVFTWKKNGNATGYIIQYSTKKDFSSKKTIKVTRNSTVKKTVKNLKAKKRYYIRIRAYKKSGNKTAYSKWSATVKVKTK